MWAVLSILCGLIVVATAVVVATGRSQPVAEVGVAEVEQLLADEQLADEQGGGAADPTRVPVVPGTPPAAPSQSVPTTVVIESIGVRAPVDPVGVEPGSGQVAVPPPERVGWYRYGPGLDAAAGSVVIAAHVDSAAGPAVFFRLAELLPGDRVVVVDEAGSEHAFTVIGREVHAKHELPAHSFARDGPPRLTLITCGGRFDRESREYHDNVVVTAVPA
ncbi:class F sortase [Natronosporangium hydrolyticum]|uniref:Class F sortase n=1 Tax=Natronosporangium hydrolyticum TaxID=2811111 RepID=A0A895YIQ3_9ACTN|nr:class F sortase [Natronosporangium hydrolyticum]